MKQQRSGFSVMRRLIVLVRPLAPFMALAVLLGVAGFVCAIFLTILGGWAILEVLGLGAPLALDACSPARRLSPCCAASALRRTGLQPFHRLQAPRAHPRSGVPRAAPALPGQA